MPTYEYICSECGHAFEEVQTMSAELLVKCPNCGKDALKRVLGGGGGMIFKGKGFYQTDYKQQSEKKEKKEKKEAKETKETKEVKKTEPAKKEPGDGSSKKSDSKEK